MRDDQFEKRMSLLKKSYERVPSSFDSKDTLQKIEEASTEKLQANLTSKTVKRFKQNTIVWMAGIASLFVIGILSTTYFLVDDQKLVDNAQGDETEVFHLDIEKAYKKEREKKRKALGLTEVQFSEISFIDMTDRTFDHVLKSPYMTRENIDTQYEDRLAELALPSEMLENLLNNPLHSNEYASLEFMGQYRDKVKSLIEFYNELLKNDEALPNDLIDGMQKQGIQIVETSNKQVVEVRYAPFKNDAEISAALHENIRGYYKMLQEEPYMVGARMVYPLEETTSRLQEMERVLIDVEEDGNLYPVLYRYYLTLFNGIVKGSSETQITDEWGVVKEEYQKVWKQLAEGDKNRPTAYMMRPIVEEMEATGWKSSSSWEGFNYKEVEDILVLAQNGFLTD